jgi:hypothetical protein
MSVNIRKWMEMRRRERQDKDKKIRRRVTMKVTRKLRITGRRKVRNVTGIKTNLEV